MRLVVAAAMSLAVISSQPAGAGYIEVDRRFFSFLVTMMSVIQIVRSPYLPSRPFPRQPLLAASWPVLRRCCSRFT
jgi:hypothetical protein